MKEICLDGEHKAIIDDEDYAKVSGFTWRPLVNKRAEKVYAQSGGRVLMHRMITDAPSGKVVDHKNGNGLDNRRDNLRVVDSVGNRANSRVDKDNRCGYKGVTYYPLNKKWGVQLIHRGKKHWFGLHDSPKAAALAYNHAALRIVGETAWMNPIIFRPFYDMAIAA